ncbi:hypothetical protein [Pseudooceanicola onchidii]|uniref:hypothetical protein n=1 Tax=Pseudooceanicola onchidii TaxID=2562279 RepID=UPI00145C0469|nr:hypothetical protein [Pseudooceanicola onchidii]
MSYIFDQASVTPPSSDTPKRRPVPEKEWRKFDFGMDCLIPAEDYALPKNHENYRD